ncbi:response regulator transcription factor [Lentibacillus cibarius]|uniref:Response regulator transcription factor n=1 Tax=Lentibacillus cibarius TaxID=2583219 RepID=A0A5S3QLD1_9BACI|nr:response regulator transcription factor [Lentibacillus cibarius]TMN22744.1 response regulator transcription factor [Lentibacillus cibarius]
MKQTILVVEDDQMIRGLIRMHLEKHDYDVVEASDGEEAQHAYIQYGPCLIILDLMLPNMSGEAFCEWVQSRQQNETSIIMLSAKSRVDDKIAGLKMGADDYLTKPFEPDELIAHVEAVLRRTGQHCQKIVHNGLCIKPRKGEVLLYNQAIQLTKHEFNLLYFLMQHPDIVHNREQLIDQLYPHAEDTVLDRTIDAHIKKLREKIETNPSTPERILTVRGMGYKFASG